MKRFLNLKPLGYGGVALLLILLIVFWPALKNTINQYSIKDRALQLNTTYFESLALDWLPDDPTPRAMEPFRRDEIGLHYRQALGELHYAQLSGDTSGLRTYFQEAALADAKNTVRFLKPVRNITWNHRIKLRFYAPDGSTVALTDTYSSLQTIEGPRMEEYANIFDREVDVVLQLDDGNWRIHHWEMVKTSSPNNDNNDASLVTRLAQVRGVGYVGFDRPFAEFWPYFDEGETTAGLSKIRELGFNTVRVFVPYPSPENIQEKLANFVRLAKDQKLEVIVVLLDNYTRYAFEDLPGIARQLKILRPVLDQSNVLAIDLKGDLEEGARQWGWPTVRLFMRSAANAARGLKLSAPITATSTQPDESLSQVLDFVSIAHADAAETLNEKLAKVQTWGRPVLVAALGHHTQEEKFPDSHTEHSQVAFYQTALKTLQAKGLGFVAWTLFDFPKDKTPNSNETLGRLGILHVDGTDKAVVTVFQGHDPPETPKRWPHPWIVLLLKQPVVWLLLVALALNGLRRRRLKKRF